jgi:hypothetical protein
MEYRGYEYAVVQSISPNRWRWSVNRRPIEKVRESLTREAAIAACIESFALRHHDSSRLPNRQGIHWHHHRPRLCPWASVTERPIALPPAMQGEAAMSLFHPDRQKGADQQQMVRGDCMARSLQTLKGNPSSYAFFGCKTQEPFRQENESDRAERAERWAASKELQPPK